MNAVQMFQDNDLVEDKASLLLLQNAWEQLSEDLIDINPFLDWQWLNQWLEECGGNKKIFVKYMTGKDGVKVIYPFELQNKNLSFLIDKNLADYAGILADDNASNLVKNGITSIVSDLKPKSILLEPISGRSPYIRDIVEGINNAGYCTELEVVCDNPYVEFPDGFEAYLKTRSKRLRQELRTTENHLNRKGNWAFSFSKNKADSKKIMEQLVKFHLARQSDKQGHSIFSEQKYQDFFLRLTEADFDSLDFSLSAIRINNIIVSAAVSIVTKHTMYYWLPSFDMNLKIGSIGKIHIRELIRNCTERGITRFDFMGGDEKYKYQWSTGSYNIYRIAAYNISYKCWYRKQKRILVNYARDLKRRSHFLSRIWKSISKLNR